MRGDVGIGKTALLRLALRNVDAVEIRGVAALASSSYAPIRAVMPSLQLSGGAADVAARLFERLGPDKPFIVDDLHWCDVDTIEVLAELAYLRPYVAATRPEVGPAVALVAQLADAGTVIDLTPLGAGGARRLARHWRPLAPEGDVAHAVDVAGGNPLALFVATTGARPVPPRRSVAACGRSVVERRDAVLRRVPCSAVVMSWRRPRSAPSCCGSGLPRPRSRARCVPCHDLFAQAAIDALPPDALAGVHRELRVGGACRPRPSVAPRGRR